jgi:Na+-driven multidrug efflux pump
MVILTLLCQLAAERMIGIFSRDPQVLSVGGQYLRIFSVTFVASGIVFVSSSMFQALGNTVPPLFSSVARILLVVVPSILLSRLPGFQLHWIWYLAAGATLVQCLSNVLLLRREYGRKLTFPEPA